MYIDFFGRFEMGMIFFILPNVRPVRVYYTFVDTGQVFWKSFLIHKRVRYRATIREKRVIP